MALTKEDLQAISEIVGAAIAASEARINERFNAVDERFNALEKKASGE